MADYATIRLECADHVTTVRLHRPEARNAFSDAMAREIWEAMVALGRDPDTRALILTGDGDAAFCAGADLKEMKARAQASGDRAWTRRERGEMLHRCFQSVRDIPKPVVAAVNGYCFGAGLELMASCDLIVASERAVFAMPEIDFAIPSIVEAALLPRMIGILKARELVMTGDRWSAAEARAVGLVNRVVPHADLARVARDLATRLAGKDAKAMAVQKDICNQWIDSDLQSAIQHSIYASAVFTGHAGQIASLEDWETRRDRP
jgi:enoyl-CoA hydratase/carnithine racemase